MDESALPHDDFPAAFEASFARLQIQVEEACAAQDGWPAKLAAAIRAGFELAAADPASASVLTRQALAAGPDGIARHRRLLAYIEAALAHGREEDPGADRLPVLTERAVAGGIVALVAERLERERVAELPRLAPEAVQFALTPYMGAAAARRVAATS